MRVSRSVGAAVVLTAGVAAVPIALVASAGAATTPHIGRQLAELKGSGTVAGDYFGYAAAISGTTAIVGAPNFDVGLGRAYIFTKTASGWKQTATLQGAGTAGEKSAAFGYSVAISGTTAIVGGPDNAYIFTKTTTGWKQTAVLKGSATVVGENFGSSVGISGTTAIVGAPGVEDTSGNEFGGNAYVFTKTRAGWTQTTILKGSNSTFGDEFGSSVAISGTNAIVGAFAEGSLVSGSAYIFTKTTTGWRQAAEIKGAHSVYGGRFGWSVAICGTTAVVGYPGYADFAGRTDIFAKTTHGWTQTAALKGSNTVIRDGFGSSVGISGDAVIVGAPGHADYTGRAYIFTKTTAGWRQAVAVRGTDSVADDWFGFSAGISDGTAIVGAPYIAKKAGRAYVLVG